LSEVLYKVLHEDGTGGYTDFVWPKPRGKRPGKWVRAKGNLIVCENGLHLLRRDDLVHWLDRHIYIAEAREERFDSDNKIVVREARLIRKLDIWDGRVARLFACDCAERALRRVTAKHGKQDPRSWAAIRVARRFACGEASADDLQTASYAAWAASDAARAASDATRAAWAARAARAASYATMAAWAARAARAASYATMAAEYEWQTARLFEYLDGKRGVE